MMRVTPFDLGFLSNFISSTKDSRSEEYSRVSILLVAVLFTGILMLSYTLNSYLTMGNYYHLKELCFLYTSVHLLSPLIYKINPSIRLVTHIFIAAGFCFQFHHGMASGGFKGETLIWFSILPLIVGIVASLSDMLVWTFIAFAGVLLQYLLTEAGFAGNDVSEAGRLWAKLNIALGYIIINVALIISYINFRDRTFKALEVKKNQIRSLVRILGHDINNPLGLIMFSSELLSTQDHDKQTFEKLLSKIDVGAQHIKAIVSSTRDYEELTSSARRLILQPLSAEEAINEALMIIEDRLIKKNVRVEKQIEPAVLLLDRSAFISQVLLNLLTNALKFSFEGDSVLIRGWKKEGKYHLEIGDCGLGIPAEVLENLFADYVVTSTPGTNGEKGTGFGMQIAYQVTKKLGGELRVRSSQNPPNRGTTFEIILEAQL